MQTILTRPEVRQVLERGGFDVVAKPPAALAARIAKEVPMWRNIVTVIGLKPE